MTRHCAISYFIAPAGRSGDHKSRPYRPSRGIVVFGRPLDGGATGTRGLNLSSMFGRSARPRTYGVRKRAASWRGSIGNVRTQRKPLLLFLFLGYIPADAYIRSR